MRYLIILLLFLVCTAHGEDRDTMYWEKVNVFDTILVWSTGDTTWHRLLDRWTFTVDTVEEIYFNFDSINWNDGLDSADVARSMSSRLSLDTTWIPLCPVFVDTTKIGVEIRNIRNIDTLDLPIPQRNLREWLNRQADKSFFEAVKQLIEEYEQ